MNKQYLQWFDSLNDTILYYYDSVSTQIEYSELKEKTIYRGQIKKNDITRAIKVELELMDNGKVEIAKQEEIYKDDTLRDSSWTILTLRSKDSILDFIHENFFIPLELVPVDGYSENTEEDETGISYKQFV